MAKLSSVQQKFILHWGEMGTRWGVNRTVAQVHALLAPLRAMGAQLRAVSSMDADLLDEGAARALPGRGVAAAANSDFEHLGMRARAAKCFQTSCGSRPSIAEVMARTLLGEPHPSTPAPARASR